MSQATLARKVRATIRQAGYGAHWQVGHWDPCNTATAVVVYPRGASNAIHANREGYWAELAYGVRAALRTAGFDTMIGNSLYLRILGIN